MAEPWIGSAELAERLGVSTATLQQWRYKGKGPKYCRPIGTHVVRYFMSDVEAWLLAGRRDFSAQQVSSPGKESAA